MLHIEPSVFKHPVPQGIFVFTDTNIRSRFCLFLLPWGCHLLVRYSNTCLYMYKPIKWNSYTAPSESRFASSSLLHSGSVQVVSKPVVLSVTTQTVRLLPHINRQFCHLWNPFAVSVIAHCPWEQRHSRPTVEIKEKIIYKCISKLPIIFQLHAFTQ